MVLITELSALWLFFQAPQCNAPKRTAHRVSGVFFHGRKTDLTSNRFGRGWIVGLRFLMFQCLQKTKLALHDHLTQDLMIYCNQKATSLLTWSHCNQQSQAVVGVKGSGYGSGKCLILIWCCKTSDPAVWQDSWQIQRKRLYSVCVCGGGDSSYMPFVHSSTKTEMSLQIITPALLTDYRYPVSKLFYSDGRGLFRDDSTPIHRAPVLNEHHYEDENDENLMLRPSRDLTMGDVLLLFIPIRIPSEGIFF